MIEGQKTLVGEHVKKLNYEERIAVGFCVHQPCERAGLLCVATERVRSKLSEVFRRQRSQLDVLHPSGFPDRLQLAHQRMRRSHFVVAERADQQKIAEVGPAQQVFQQIECCQIEPLQIIEEERQGMFRPSEDADELAEHQLEAPLCILRRKLGDRWRLSDDQLHFGNEIRNQTSVRSQRLPQRLAPRRKIYFALSEQRPNQALKGLGQRRIRNVALVLIELAGREKATGRYQHRLQLVDDRGLADAGIARDQDELRRTAIDDAIECRKQGLDLTSPSVEFLGNQQPVGRVSSAQREVGDTTPGSPFGQAVSQVALEAGGGLVAIFGYLGEQLYHDVAYGRWQPGDTLAGRWRLARDMAVHPLHRVAGDKRQGTGEHLVEGDAEGVEVAAGID